MTNGMINTPSLRFWSKTIVPEDLVSKETVQHILSMPGAGKLPALAAYASLTHEPVLVITSPFDGSGHRVCLVSYAVPYTDRGIDDVQASARGIQVDLAKRWGIKPLIEGIWNSGLQLEALRSVFTYLSKSNDTGGDETCTPDFDPVLHGTHFGLSRNGSLLRAHNGQWVSGETSNPVSSHTALLTRAILSYVTDRFETRELDGLTIDPLFGTISNERYQWILGSNQGPLNDMVETLEHHKLTTKKSWAFSGGRYGSTRGHNFGRVHDLHKKLLSKLVLDTSWYKPVETTPPTTQVQQNRSDEPSKSAITKPTKEDVSDMATHGDPPDFKMTEQSFKTPASAPHLGADPPDGMIIVKSPVPALGAKPPDGMLIVKTEQAERLDKVTETARNAQSSVIKLRAALYQALHALETLANYPDLADELYDWDEMADAVREALGESR